MKDLVAFPEPSPTPEGTDDPGVGQCFASGLLMALV
jgi:hypothetical protein